MERIASISVDLDEIPCYTAIHGLEAPSASSAHAVYERCVPRLAQMFEDEGVAATFFVIGRDMESPGVADTLRALHRSGHELGNHTQHHFYDLTRRDPATMRSEVMTCSAALEGLTGKRTRGFRAPGYVVTQTLLGILGDARIEYDSSVFPCPPYYAAKSAAIALIRARGRASHSILDDPRVLLAPAEPYRVGNPYWTRGRGLYELPIGVLPPSRGFLPYIGTTLALAGPARAATLTRWMAARSFVNLELHGIDVADAKRDGLEFLTEHQPDLRRPRAEKEETLRAVIRTLRECGYRFVTLAEATRIVGQAG